MADDLMRELAPLLAEDGIDLNDPNSIHDMESLQRALDRAVERRNMQLFTPVGEPRALAVTTLRLFVEAIADDQADLAEAILATAVPESPDGSQAIVGSGHPEAPAGIGARAKLPKGQWFGERAARDILDLARRGRAFRALDSLMVKQGSPAVQAGAALALAGAMQAWADLAGEPVDRVALVAFRDE